MGSIKAFLLSVLHLLVSSLLNLMQHKCFFIAGQKRKRGYDSSAAEDEDFVCLAEDSEEDLVRPPSKRSSRGFTAKRMSVSLTLPSLCRVASGKVF